MKATFTTCRWFTTVLAFVATCAQAEVRNFKFQGTITQVSNTEFYLDNSVAAGTAFEGFYIYDTATADSNADTTVGDYRHTNGMFGMVVKVGNYTFRTNPEHVDFLLETVNRSTDHYLIRSYHNLCSRPLMVEHMSWQLDSNDGSALTNDSLPTVPPTLSNYVSPFGMTISGVFGSYMIRGTVNLIEENPAIIPQRPKTDVELAVEVKWQSALGYYYQIQSSTNQKDWDDVGEPILGDGTVLSQFFPKDGRNLFYRAEIKNFSN